MGLRGPPPTPTSILEARGSWRAKARQGEPRPPVEAPACPDFLDAEAKAEWSRQIEQLLAIGCITKLDRAALTLWCAAWSEYKFASEIVTRTPLVPQRNASGEIIPGTVEAHPAARIRDRAADRLLKVAAQFGFTPAARARLRSELPEPGEEDAQPTLYKIRG